MAEFESTQISGREHEETQECSQPVIHAEDEDFAWCKGVFKARMSTDRMECEDDAKSIPVDAIVTFDDSINPVLGNVVLAKVGGVLLIRELAECDGKTVLRARNSAYPDIVLDSNSCVMAKAISRTVWRDV